MRRPRQPRTFSLQRRRPLLVPQRRQLGLAACSSVRTSIHYRRLRCVCPARASTPSYLHTLSPMPRATPASDSAVTGPAVTDRYASSVAPGSVVRLHSTALGTRAAPSHSYSGSFPPGSEHGCCCHRRRAACVFVPCSLQRQCRRCVAPALRRASVILAAGTVAHACLVTPAGHVNESWTVAASVLDRGSPAAASAAPSSSSAPTAVRSRTARLSKTAAATSASTELTGRSPSPAATTSARARPRRR